MIYASHSTKTVVKSISDQISVDEWAKKLGEKKKINDRERGILIAFVNPAGMWVPPCV